jgi:hypothetical protein
MTAVTCGNLRVEIVSNAGIRHARARQAGGQPSTVRPR